LSEYAVVMLFVALFINYCRCRALFIMSKSGFKAPQLKDKTKWWVLCIDAFCYAVNFTNMSWSRAGVIYFNILVCYLQDTEFP